MPHFSRQATMPPRGKRHQKGRTVALCHVPLDLPTKVTTQEVKKCNHLNQCIQGNFSLMYLGYMKAQVKSFTSISVKKQDHSILGANFWPQESTSSTQRYLVNLFRSMLTVPFSECMILTRLQLSFRYQLPPLSSASDVAPYICWHRQSNWAEDHTWANCRTWASPNHGSDEAPHRAALRRVGSRNIQLSEGITRSKITKETYQSAAITLFIKRRGRWAGSETIF